MSANDATYYSQQFATVVQILLQQKGSRLRGTVMEGTHVGKQAEVVDQVGSVNIKKRTTRYPKLTPQDVPADARWVFPTDYDMDPILRDSIDKLRSMADPTSQQALAATYAFGRGIDDEILAAIHGTSKTGATGSTSTTLPTSTSTGQVISVNVGGTGSGLNVEKLKKALERFSAAEVDLDNDPIYCAITAKQNTDLLNEIQIIGSDFKNGPRPVLQEGRVTNFMGINFIHSERVLTGTDDQSNASSRAVPMWVKSGVYLGMWNDVQMQVSQRNDLGGHPWQVYGQMTLGATRIEEQRVLKVWCVES